MDEKKVPLPPPPPPDPQSLVRSYGTPCQRVEAFLVALLELQRTHGLAVLPRREDCNLMVHGWTEDHEQAVAGAEDMV
jgi:hypothetical protein